MSDDLRVSGDVDDRHGDIEVGGAVAISGSVSTGRSIRAGGDVAIGGKRIVRIKGVPCWSVEGSTGPCPANAAPIFRV
jgi:hypothetical protein